MDDEDDVAQPYVAVRPYSADPTAADQPPARERKLFRPRPPVERRKVEKSLLSSVPYEETAQSLLQGALRRQDADYGAAAGFRAPPVPQRFQGMSLSKFGVNEFGRAPHAAQFAAGPSGAPVPRKMKEWREGRSMELMDLAFTPMRRAADGTMRKHYPPISLPYFNFAEDEGGPEAGGDGTGAPNKRRPTLHHVDEGNSNAAKELFLNPDGDLQEDNFFLIQLPCVLPELLDPGEEVQREQEDAATTGVGAGITRLPDGLLGKLKIHRSGKVRMEIGGLPFCVDQGCQTFFQQDLACVCPLAKEVVNLGAIHNRVVLTPDVGAMLAELVEAPVPGKQAHLPGAG